MKMTLSTAPMLRWFEVNKDTSIVQFVDKWLAELGRTREDVLIVEFYQPSIYGTNSSQPMPLMKMHLAFKDDELAHREVYAADLPEAMPEAEGRR